MQDKKAQYLRNKRAIVSPTQENMYIYSVSSLQLYFGMYTMKHKRSQNSV